MFMPVMEILFGLEKSFCPDTLMTNLAQLRVYYPPNFQQYLTFLSNSPLVSKL